MAEPFTTNEALDEFGNFPKRVLMFLAAGWLGGSLPAIENIYSTAVLLMTWPFAGFAVSTVFGLAHITLLGSFFYHGAVMSRYPVLCAVGFMFTAALGSLLTLMEDNGQRLGNLMLFAIVCLAAGTLFIRHLRRN